MAALAGVRDPELDESVTELGFVDGVIVSGGRVEVSLRLPTYFCAPNFAWLMVDDAHAALSAIPGVREVLVRLVDHFAADEINAGLRGGQGFEATFAGLADGELDALRETFRRKALAARQDRMCRMPWVTCHRAPTPTPTCGAGPSSASTSRPRRRSSSTGRVRPFRRNG